MKKNLKAQKSLRLILLILLSLFMIAFSVSCTGTADKGDGEDGDDEITGDEGLGGTSTEIKPRNVQFRIPFDDGLGYHNQLFTAKGKVVSGTAGVDLTVDSMKNSKDYKTLREMIMFSRLGEYDGLYSSPEGGIQCYDKNGKFMGTEAASGIYYARFTKKIMNIRYSGITDPESYGLPTKLAVGQKFGVTHLPVIEKEGHIFLGWRAHNSHLGSLITNPDGKIIEMYDPITSSCYFISDTMVFSPTYELIYDIPLKLDYNDGTYRTETKYCSKFEALSAEALLNEFGETNEFKTIVGWSYDKEGTQLFTGGTLTETDTLYAVWESYRYIFVSYDVGDEEIVKVTENAPVVLKTPTKDGYEFCGWFDNELRSGIPISETVSYGDPYECYYALWRKTE